MKNILLLFIFFSCFITQSQTIPKKQITKFFEVSRDTIQIDTVSISPLNFKVYNSLDQIINPNNYQILFDRAQLILNKKIVNTTSIIKVSYESLPEFLTKKYAVLNQKIIAHKTTDLSSLYNPNSQKNNKNSKLFDGLYTSGSLSRGVTMGNNQDAVVNSNFNLQIEGNLSENVGIRASITDNNIPLQEGGYTQRLNEFDRVFIEMYGKNWNIKAGDIYLQNTENYFLKFNKKVAGVYVDANIDHNLGNSKVFASGALVRGKFTTYNFTGEEGNQGPYKIMGENNEQFFLIVSGSETVYANGTPLKRGENYDYIIDYNNGEIIFTTLYPVNANMRFTIDFQIVENNYTRFITYDGAEINTDKLHIGVKYYNETDSKNKTLHQDLTEDQKQILANAGDDTSKMVSISAVPQIYSENKILYKKIIESGIEKFVYSNDPDDELYEVKFSFVGENNGNYYIETTIAPGRVYTFIDPVNNIKQGSYAPVIRLIAPQKLQIADIDMAYHFNEKSVIRSELAFSNNDQNLFSSIDNENNNGFATKINWKQRIIDKNWKLDGIADYEYVSDNFQTVERYRNVEFSRDWNIKNIDSINNYDQQYFTGGLTFSNEEKGIINYQYENLKFNEFFKGNRHNLFTNLKLNNTQFNVKGSAMQSRSIDEENVFYRLFSSVKHNFDRSWVGGKVNYEHNNRKELETQILNKLSHQITEIEGFGGIGDSTKVFTEIGYNYQIVDSVQNNSLQKVNDAHTFFINSKLIQNKTTDLSIYGNYRKVDHVNFDNEESLNARLMYRQTFLKNFIAFNTVYETQSGTLPQQDYSYVEVEPGKGFYNWIDFNDNNIQELDEFVVAKFQDEAIYVRILLPNTNFIKTHRNKFSQSLNINAKSWQNNQGIKKVLSHFSEQAYFIINASEKREGNSINFNPFKFDEKNLLSLDLQIKNSLFFNRGIQKYSTGYIYLNSRKKSFFSYGDQDNQIKSHQLQFSHKLNDFWLLDFNGILSEIESRSNTYANRNYFLNNYEVNPKVSFLYKKNARLEAFYSYKNKENQIIYFETLRMHVLGVNFQYSNRQKFSINANFNWISNDFEGNQNTPVAYQMLEGLQPGNNMTWLLSFQKRLTSFLDLNINYFGRNSENSKTIHTGTVQLRASF